MFDLFMPLYCFLMMTSTLKRSSSFNKSTHLIEDPVNSGYKKNSYFFF